MGTHSLCSHPHFLQGLGIGKYTHFTSPIRRYADLVVHRFLLSSLNTRRPEKGYMKVHRLANGSGMVLNRIPESNAMPTLAGDGPTNNRQCVTKDTVVGADDIDDIDALIDGAAELLLGSNLITERENTKTSPANASMPAISTQSQSYESPYQENEVAKICSRLNQQNRMAKACSRECQTLFLSLYFRQHTEIVSAVVISLRVNGVIVYVPKYDLKGLVYICDREGNVNIDPLLVGLTGSPACGVTPSQGFDALSTCRKFPSGSCNLHDTSPDDSLHHLAVSVPEGTKALQLKTLDIVSVQIVCDALDSAVARVPPPRLYLVSRDRRATISIAKATTAPATESKLCQSGLETDRQDRSNISSPITTPSMQGSFYKVINSIDITPKLPPTPSRMVSVHIITETESNSVRKPDIFGSGRVQSIPGRVVYGGFRNPDTLKAHQEASFADAANNIFTGVTTLRGAHDMTSYDQCVRLEREVTVRTQRLAADKRDTRISKAKSSR